MKKIIALTLAATLALGLTACKQNVTPTPTTVTNPTTPPEVEELYKIDSYTGTADAVIANKDTIVATLGDTQLRNSTLQLYYWLDVYDYLSNYGTNGLDLSKSLHEQKLGDYGTWQHAFLGSALTGAYKISQQKSYDGSSPEKALICWLNSGAAIDDALFEAIREKAEEYQNDNAAKTPSSASAFFPDFWPDGDAPDETQPEETQPVETKPQETQPAETKPQETQPEETKPQETKPEETKPQETQPEESKPQETQPGETEPEHEHFDVNSYYVVIKVTQGNMSLGNRLIWQGLKVTKGSDGFRFQFSDAVVTDHMMVQTGEGEEVNRPEIDFGSGFTAGQIAEMRADQEKKIKDLEFQIKMAEANYKIMQTEVNDGNVYAEIDGEVVSVLTEEEAKQTMQPVLKVSGGGGFYVEGSVSELEKDNMKIGQEVTVNDWNTGMVYTGIVQSLGDFPSSSNGWNGMGNPTASFYPFTVFIEGDADLQEGRYVSVMYSTATSEHGIYLENPFLRTEQGKSYVYVMGEDGKLEKRFVQTGKSLWGSYMEILSGLSEEDMVAFPYGKNVKDGAAAQEGDLSNLYG